MCHVHSFFQQQKDLFFLFIVPHISAASRVATVKSQTAQGFYVVILRLFTFHIAKPFCTDQRLEGVCVCVCLCVCALEAVGPIVEIKLHFSMEKCNNLKIVTALWWGGQLLIADGWCAVCVLSTVWPHSFIFVSFVSLSWQVLDLHETTPRPLPSTVFPFHY